jgi:manganese oxidase
MSKLHRYILPIGVLVLVLFAVSVSAKAQTPTCNRTISADVVALDQVFFWNRLGAVEPQGMIFALKRDVVPINPALGLVAGNVQLRADKRPRPIALRMNVGDCLQINFTNLLNPTPVDQEQPATRTASVHVVGMQLRNSIADDGSNVGSVASPGSLVSPGGAATYTFYAEREGAYMLHSTAANTGGEGDGGSLDAGLFGTVNVQPASAEWYRSQVTADDLQLATIGHTADGHPIINYNAVYPAGHPRAGTPILKMLNGTEVVHTDLNAIITGPNAGRFPAGTYRDTPVNPDRNQPFREFTIIYHDEVGAVQAFPQFEQQPLKHTLHSVRDAFAINYGTGGIGAEIIANRIGVGPVFNCTECKYEEFFLSSWPLGDPAMVVDVPANAPCTPESIRLGTCTPTPGPKATKALYPDDPSNVHHSYINDHTKMRIVHGGAKEHHIHHLHAHQWVHTPDDDNSTYLDSQAIGPGSSFTLEITYNGSGNRNKVVGDSIFHCHFYPHFAMGMWELWRSHDVFEFGTPLDANGRPAAGSRALPDAEILAGTPIPALVPVPTLAMAPLAEAQAKIVNGQVVITGAGNPGYPFFNPAVAGHRPPHPPLDSVDDGGLPRHIITGGTFNHTETRLDFDKTLLTANATAIPETGTAVELAAMAFHAVRNHQSFKPDGTAASFVTNGLPAQPGAPYADPCISDAGTAVGVPRIYKAADIQFDIKLNKEGWHFPQQRILALWGDVAPTLAGTRPPQPFFFRANTNDCITYYHTNLVPNVYKLDDFQVRTPTDILGQHIHLVKFDVTSSDGSGNGWNYEDGTFSPDEVLERIAAINAAGGLVPFGGGTGKKLTPVAHPFFGTLGAQTTVQRWYADSTLNLNGNDRTLRTVFTHDHFGPSTHQQVGLYAGLVIEPQNSVWRDPETGEVLGGRFDGGPTSWHADILTSATAQSYREFMFEFADFQHAYLAGRGGDAANPIPDPGFAINPPGRIEIGLPFLFRPPVNPGDCPGGVDPPCPEAISSADVGTMVTNYRNESVALRVRDPNTNAQAAGDAGDLSKVYLSNILRADPLLNVQPNFYPPLTGGVQPGDPFTPLLRAYENDKVQIRILVGAHEEGHNFTVHGHKWLFEPGTPQDPVSSANNNTGYRNSQMMGISEHFEFVAGAEAAIKNGVASADFLYKPGASVDDQWPGLWGLFRVYNGAVSLQPNLLTLPNNVDGKAPRNNENDFAGICPKTAPTRALSVTAVTAQQVIPGGRLVYNNRNFSVTDPVTGQVKTGPLNDPTAILYVRSSDIDSKTGKIKAGVPIEPLVLRANAGECIKLTLTNNLPAVLPDLAGFNSFAMLIPNFNANQVAPSNQVGLHPQLVSYDVTSDDGANAGFNPVQTVGPGGIITYKWYAGNVFIGSTGLKTAAPVEFGAINLISSDPIKHSNKGAIGSLIIEPAGSTWVEDATSRAQATVTPPSGPSFRDFVLQFQNDVNLRFGDGTAVPIIAEEEDPEDGSGKAVNYRTEPMWTRLQYFPSTALTTTRTFNFTNALNNVQVAGIPLIPTAGFGTPQFAGDPVTPIFKATAGTPVRFRALMSNGHQRNNIFVVHGHAWQEEPFANNSTVIGSNPFSEVKGAEMGVGPSFHFNAIPLNGAGGKFKVKGDYLFRTFQSFQFDAGIWGLFRVN